MPRKTIFAALQDMVEASLPVVFFVGGEPMSRFADLVDCVAYSRGQMDTRMLVSGGGASVRAREHRQEAGAEVESMTGPDPFSCAMFLIIALVLAGIFQTGWLKLRCSGRFAIALDGGRTFQGRRLLGDHKTVRGFMVMVPATGVTFLLLAQLLRVSSPALAGGIWQLSAGQYLLLGLGAGLGFMLGELPNSFLKRRLGIPPGAAPSNATARAAFFFLDRLDSIVGLLVAVSLLVPTAWSVWAWVLLIGPAIHWSFSLLFCFLGMKTHPA